MSRLIYTRIVDESGVDKTGIYPCSVLNTEFRKYSDVNNAKNNANHKLLFS